MGGTYAVASFIRAFSFSSKKVIFLIFSGCLSDSACIVELKCDSQCLHVALFSRLLFWWPSVLGCCVSCVRKTSQRQCVHVHMMHLHAVTACADFKHVYRITCHNASHPPPS